MFRRNKEYSQYSAREMKKISQQGRRVKWETLQKEHAETLEMVMSKIRAAAEDGKNEYAWNMSSTSSAVLWATDNRTFFEAWFRARGYETIYDSNLPIGGYHMLFIRW